MFLPKPWLYVLNHLCMWAFSSLKRSLKEDKEEVKKKKKEQKAFVGKCFLRQDFEKEEFIRTGNQTGKENQSVLELLRRVKNNIWWVCETRKRKEYVFSRYNEQVIKPPVVLSLLFIFFSIVLLTKLPGLVRLTSQNNMKVIFMVWSVSALSLFLLPSFTVVYEQKAWQGKREMPYCSQTSIFPFSLW